MDRHLLPLQMKERLKSYSSNTMKSGNDAGTKYRAGSLASKANIMQNYNNDKDK